MESPNFKGSCIYKIYNIVDDRVYIGSAYNFNNRKYQHLSKLRNGSHPNRILLNFFAKYGEGSLKMGIVETIDDVLNLIEREQYYIDTMQPKFNILKIAGTDYHIGRKRTDETRAAMSEKRRGFVYSEESRKRMSDSRKRCMLQGQINSKLTIEQVREIKLLLAQGVKGKDIAERFNIKATQISNIKKGRSWSNIII